ncbi:hypothetical protein IW262DRAFT_1455063 [Armillaria fumosa]|nr:hypothetical protein IW262DRAFT_1455063 [Armillaria fumosa]
MACLALQDTPNEMDVPRNRQLMKHETVSFVRRSSPLTGISQSTTMGMFFHSVSCDVADLLITDVDTPPVSFAAFAQSSVGIQKGSSTPYDALGNVATGAVSTTLGKGTRTKRERRFGGIETLFVELEDATEEHISNATRANWDSDAYKSHIPIPAHFGAGLVQQNTSTLTQTLSWAPSSILFIKLGLLNDYNSSSTSRTSTSKPFPIQGNLTAPSVLHCLALKGVSSHSSTALCVLLPSSALSAVRSSRFTVFHEKECLEFFGNFPFSSFSVSIVSAHVAGISLMQDGSDVDAASRQLHIDYLHNPHNRFTVCSILATHSRWRSDRTAIHKDITALVQLFSKPDTAWDDCCGKLRDLVQGDGGDFFNNIKYAIQVLDNLFNGRAPAMDPAPSNPLPVPHVTGHIYRFVRWCRRRKPGDVPERKQEV